MCLLVVNLVFSSKMDNVNLVIVNITTVLVKDAKFAITAMCYNTKPAFLKVV